MHWMPNGNEKVHRLCFCFNNIFIEDITAEHWENKDIPTTQNRILLVALEILLESFDFSHDKNLALNHKTFVPIRKKELCTIYMH